MRLHFGNELSQPCANRFRAVKSNRRSSCNLPQRVSHLVLVRRQPDVRHAAAIDHLPQIIRAELPRLRRTLRLWIFLCFEKHINYLPREKISRHSVLAGFQQGAHLITILKTCPAPFFSLAPIGGEGGGEGWRSNSRTVSRYAPSELSQFDPVLTLPCSFAALICTNFFCPPAEIRRDNPKLCDITRVLRSLGNREDERPASLYSSPISLTPRLQPGKTAKNPAQLFPTI